MMNACTSKLNFNHEINVLCITEYSFAALFLQVYDAISFNTGAGPMTSIIEELAAITRQLSDLH